MQQGFFYFFHIVQCHVPLPINKSRLKLLGRLIELADRGMTCKIMVSTSQNEMWDSSDEVGIGGLRIYGSSINRTICSCSDVRWTGSPGAPISTRLPYTVITGHKIKQVRHMVLWYKNTHVLLKKLKNLDFTLYFFIYIELLAWTHICVNGDHVHILVY
jgi:hypothetical protein